jgi:L-aminopeptidase/D-esterase-like protein
VIDPRSGRILAGLLSEDLTTFSNTEEVMAKDYKGQKNPFKSNTTIGVIVTNARLTKPQAGKLASMAHNGYARTIRPSHTMFDGDTIFALARGTVDADLSAVGLLSARVVEEAVIRAVKSASSLCGLRGYTDFIR